MFQWPRKRIATTRTRYDRLAMADCAAGKFSNQKGWEAIPHVILMDASTSRPTVPHVVPEMDISSEIRFQSQNFLDYCGMRSTLHEFPALRVLVQID